MPKTGRVRRGIAVVPTLLTLGNGFCGFLAISKMVDAITIGDGEGFTEKILQAAWLIFLAMLFDALDGRVARLTNQASDFGVQLDSLNDVVSFGVAPALLVKVVYEHALVQAGIPFNLKLTLLLSSLFVLCGILRLARFTLDTDTKDSTHGTFSGLPTPAAAGLLASAVLFLSEGGGSLGLKMSNPLVLTLTRGFIFFPPLLGLLMICKIEYVHLVQRYVRGRKTFNYLALGLVCVFLVAFCNDWAIFLVSVLYVLSGPVLACVRLVRKPGRTGNKSGAKKPGGNEKLQTK